MASRHHDNATFTHKIKTDGEVTINLVLTIKLDSDGLALSASSVKSSKHTTPIDDGDDDVKFVVPDIQSEDIIQFGEKIE